MLVEGAEEGRGERDRREAGVDRALVSGHSAPVSDL